MCGIVGIVTPDVKRYHNILQRMNNCLSHRGPDADGIYMFNNCGLGHRRLSIVDLLTGAQPMLSKSGETGITFNGEIYGYKDLRLLCDDYPFQTTSDTEVILALYYRYGKRLMPRLPGMFAFAIWDENTQALFCARDRFGEKPFYYSFGRNGEFIFASEIKAILASGIVDPVLDREMLRFYLQYLYIHPNRTIYQNIFTLPPAHSLLYRDGLLTVEKYWELPSSNESIDQIEAIEEFDRLLDNAVSKQLIADVPVGAFLSGGLDSSSIVAYASRHKTKLMTFSFGFENGQNELSYARDVAEKYHTEHIELSDKDIDVGELLITMQRIFDEPFADTSNIPTYLISKLARKYAKVILTGDGGDELLGGYSWYKPLLEMEDLKPWKMLFYPILLRARWLSYKMNIHVPNSVQSTLQKMKFKNQFQSIASAHHQGRQYFSDLEMMHLGIGNSEESNIMFQKYDSTNTVDDALRMDIETYMAGDILVKIDRASMAHGLELRSPLLDVDFATFCISLPYKLKLRSGVDKYILRKACGELWPDSVQKRGKLGFGLTSRDWFTKDAYSNLINIYLKDNDLKIYRLIDSEKCRPIVENNDVQTWTLLVLSMWLESHEFAFPDQTETISRNAKIAQL